MPEGFDEPRPRSSLSIISRSLSRLSFRRDFTAISENVSRRFLQCQLALQVFKANSPPAVAQSFHQHLMVRGHRKTFEDMRFPCSSAGLLGSTACPVNARPFRTAGETPLLVCGKSCPLFIPQFTG